PDRPRSSSMIPLDCEARDRSQQVRLGAMAGEMLDRLGDEEARLLARTLFAEQRNESRLAGMGVLAGALARRGLVPAMVDQIVGDLECQPDIARIAAIRRSRVGGQLDHDARRLYRIFDQRPGLELLKAGDR